MYNFNHEIENIAKSFDKPPIFDGIINEIDYKNANVKLLWVLKDANSNGEDESYDLRLAINDLKTESGIRKGWANTFANIVYVTNGILNNNTWEEVPYYYDDPSFVDALKKIAYINVKKTGGGSQSIKNELQDYYNFSKDLLFNQINEFNPDVIIFGNTYFFFKNDLGLNEMVSFGTCEAIKDAKRIYINANHPNARISQEKYFNDVLEAYNHFKD